MTEYPNTDDVWRGKQGGTTVPPVPFTWADVDLLRAEAWRLWRADAGAESDAASRALVDLYKRIRATLPPGDR